MQLPDIITLFIKPLNENDLHYVITGSIASLIYGEIRVTHDIDLVLNISESQVADFLNAYSSKDFYKPPVEVVTIERSRTEHGHINLIHNATGFKADVYFCGRDKLNLWALRNFKRIEFKNGYLKVAPIEYVIIKKLMFYRESNMEKHVLDIIGMLKKSSKEIDKGIFENLIEEYSLQKEWNHIKNQLTIL